MLRFLDRVRSMMEEAFYTRCSICKGVILYVTFIFLSFGVMSEQLVFSRQLNVCMRRRSPQPTHQVTFRRVATIDLRCVLLTPDWLPRQLGTHLCYPVRYGVSSRGAMATIGRTQMPCRSTCFS